MAKNGAKWILVSIAVAGIIWNAATLHNDVGHLEEDMAEMKEVQKGQAVLLVEILNELRK